MANRNIDASKRNKVYKRDNYTCRYCGMKNMEHGVISLDHVIPLARGGSNLFDNLVTSCCYCNNKKHDKSLIESGLNLINLE